MSFVYAEIQNELLNIHCDTKIKLDDYAGASISQEQIDAICKYGIVKITLICSEIGIAFAGNNIYLASKLFCQLYEKRTFTTQEVVDMAYNIHANGDIDDIEFIVVSCEDDNLSISCIKEREIFSNCPFAWIGSPVAHSEFQKIRNKNNKGMASDRTEMAFLKVVQCCSDNTVGGFHIVAGYNPTTKKLCFKESKSFQTTKPQLVHFGQKIWFNTKAEDGGFSFEQIPISLEELVLNIEQMESDILYSRRLRMNERDLKNSQLF